MFRSRLVGVARTLTPTSALALRNVNRTLGVCPWSSSHLLRRRFSFLPNQPSETSQEKKVNPQPSKVFVNNEVNLKYIDVYGFDYDWTLCDYKDKLQPLIYDLAKKYLVEQLWYPAEFSTYSNYDPNFAIRGLFFDVKTGILMKMNVLNNIALQAFFGRRKLEIGEILKIYGGSRHIATTYQHQNLRPMWDLFCLPEACLIADLIQYFTNIQLPFDPFYLFQDVRKAVAAIHINGNLHEFILQHKSEYFNQSSELFRSLKKLKQAGKKLFLLTNNQFKFIDAGLKYIMQHDLESAKESWEDLFDVIIVRADKPNFFNSDRPFRVIDRETLRPKWQSLPTTFQPGNIYTEGSMKELSRLTNWKGPNTLYIGDHLYADVVAPVKVQGWRTGIVLKEVQKEVEIRHSKEYEALALELSVLEEKLHRALELGVPEQELEELEKGRTNLLLKMGSMFNKNFGSIFRSQSSSSLFAFHLARYADIYTAKIENILKCPINHRFYRSRRALPHEPQKPYLDVQN